MPQEQEICCFWGGGALNYLDLLSIRSFQAVGHPVTIYAYDPPPNAPAGVVLCDAAEIAPNDAAPPSLIEDYLRYRVLAARPGVIWARPDFVLTRALRPEDGVLLARQGAHLLTADVLALPPDSPALQQLIAFTDQEHPVPPWASKEQQQTLAAADPPLGPTDLEWGVWGALALTHFANASGEAETASPQKFLYPLAYRDRAFLLRRKAKIGALLGDDVAAIPLYSAETARQLFEVEEGLPRYWTPLGALMRQHEIAPRAAPIFGKPPEAFDRWVEKAVPAPVSKPVPAPAKRAPIGEKPKVCIVTTMKNEGPFILEWIAYHRSIGIDGFIVYTNDCDDGTDQLLDLLVEKGLVTARIDNPYSSESKAGDWQRAALWDAQAGDLVGRFDWIIPMDVDEFVNIHVGDGTWADLVAAAGDPNMISMVWRLFGNGFLTTYEDRFVTETMTHAARADCNKPHQAWGFKTAFKDIGAYRRWSVHRPQGLNPEKKDDIHWMTGSGQPMPETYMQRGWRALKTFSEYNLVSLNHYAVRNCESYLVKRQRGRVNHIDEDQGLAYWFRMNHNSEEELSIQPRLGPARTEHERIMQDAEITAAHNACVAAHKARIDELMAVPDYKSLYDATSSPRMRNLSRLVKHFGNQIFDIGPKAVPPDFVAWAEQLDEHGEPAPGQGPAPVDPGGGTLAPPPEFTAEVEARKLENEQMRARSAAARAKTDEDAPKQRKPQDEPIAAVAAIAPSGDPIYLGENDAIAFKSLLGRTQPRYPFLTPISPARSHDKITVITSMKNEGPFILEWIAYHRAIGVTHFLVYTNDCDDPTNDILDHLAAKGWLTRLDNPFNRKAGQKPQRGALNHAIKQEVVQSADWYLVIDVDEFVNIHVGDGTLKALAEAANDPSVISMSWRFFGNKGVEAYEDRWVTEQFFHCAPQYLPRPRLGWGFKSMIRTDAPVGKIGVHRPLNINWKQEDNLRWVNGSGREMPRKTMKGSAWFSRKASIGYDMVTLNHYILRSAESFLVKRERGRINHVDQDQGLEYWATRNYATERDESILVRLDPAKAVLDDLMADPKLAALHDAAVNWHQDRIAKLKADPDYLKLYEMITDPTQKDAIFVAEAEPEDVSD